MQIINVVTTIILGKPITRLDQVSTQLQLGGEGNNYPEATTSECLRGGRLTGNGQLMTV